METVGQGEVVHFEREQVQLGPESLVGLVLGVVLHGYLEVLFGLEVLLQMALVLLDAHIQTGEDVVELGGQGGHVPGLECLLTLLHPVLEPAVVTLLIIEEVVLLLDGYFDAGQVVGLLSQTTPPLLALLLFH